MKSTSLTAGIITMAAAGALFAAPAHATTSSVQPPQPTAEAPDSVAQPQAWVHDRSFSWGPGATYRYEQQAVAACGARAVWWSAQGVNAQCIGPSGRTYETIREI